MPNDAKDAAELRLELVRRRLAERGLATAEPVRRAGVRAGERHGLSTGQRRMWFLQTLDPADSTLNICIAYRLTGDIDAARLRGAFDRVVSRHAILRTTYGTDSEGEPYQVSHDGLEIGWQEHDLAGLSAVEQDRRIEALARSEFGKSFDLAADSPLRITFARTGAHERVMLLVVHHICWDDDSTAVFLTELSAAYNGREPDRQAPQFVSVGVADTDAEVAEADIAYWRDSLRPVPEPLELFGSAAAGVSRRAERRAQVLPAELFRRVEAFAQQRSASPFMVLLAAFGALIRRYTGASDFLISIPVTERSAATEGALGYFGNTLLLRNTVEADDTFSSFVDAVRDTCLRGFAHQSVGIDRVVREANPGRTMGRDGMEQLVALGFSMRKTASELALDGVTARQLELGAVTAQLPLALAVVREPDAVGIEFEYQADVLPEALVKQMPAHFVQLLDDALIAPDRRLTALDMLGDDARTAVLSQSCGTLAATAATTMVALLESAAATTPDAVALVSDETELTYAELHRRANRLARWLIGQGVGADDVIGLRMTTSIEFIVAVLAALKAGAAYLPIDPAYPDERIDYLIADARPKTVIGREGFDAAEQAAAQHSDAALTDAERLRPLRPEHLAYVIYTSGSTGRPKGVAVPHHAIAEHIDGFIAEWSMTAEDRLLQSSSVSFDASLLDIFVTLALGARLIVPKPDAFGDIPYVADLISRHGVTVLHMVPSMLHTLLLLPQVSQWRQLRLVPVGGEALPGDLVERFASYFGAELRNHYGPTEAVVCSTHMSVNGSPGGGVVPIGVPNRNVYAYVLDDGLQPVPASVVGELYLGGAQLARGYLGRPALTAQRFVADPFNPGQRLYRSGDLVRRNHSGALEFVGRADEQVKIRGFRIELGEVEAVIATHPAVSRCVVLAEESESGPMLAAFVIPAGERAAPIDLDDLRAHAASHLPEYMVPSAYAVIPEIPLTVSGKLDRRALPAAARISARDHREPTTSAERRMCTIFARLFGCERVSADDSFFELGGHSLLAARLVVQIRAEFGTDCNVRAVFDTPTPAGLAGRLGPRTGSSSRPELVETVRADRPALSYSQLAMLFHQRMRGANDVFNMALTLRFNGPLSTVALTESINDVVARHDALRTNIVEHEGVPYQLVHPTVEVKPAVADVSADEVDQTVAELRRHVFALDSEPLIRPTLLAVDTQLHVLVLLIHHIVADHVSLGVVFDDLKHAYRTRLEGEAPQWATAPVQFAEYSRWQRDTFDAPSEWGQAQLDHWREVLAGLPGDLSVVPDHTRPLVLGRRAEVATFVVPADRRAALMGLAEQMDATEFVVYQAALAVVLHKLGGGTDIVIGSPVASRVDVLTADLVGPCANVVVLRTDLSGDPSLRTVAARSRDTVLDALAHQELPVERLVEALNPPRSPSRNHPLFQNALHFRGEDWSLISQDVSGNGETAVVPVALDFDASLLDLNVAADVTPAGEVDIRIVANADLYEPQTARHIADAFDTVLAAFAATPDAAMSSVEVLPPVIMQMLLAAPAPNSAEPAQPVAAGGSDETEGVLIALLEELLDITGVDRDDNFFALGGDSIIAVQMSARANAQGLALTPAMVFEHMTIAELAGVVDAAADQPASDEVPQQEINASGLDADALAALTASWQQQA